ncbi:MAG: trypsin-like peptidase domain-containing protein [Planctomycetota bacterium]
MSRIMPPLTLAALLLFSASADANPPAATSDYDRRRSPVVEVFEQSRAAVVNLSTTRVVRMRSLGFDSFLDDVFDFGQPRRLNRKVHSVGSGVVVHASGYIVTNAHVVAQASDVQVTFVDGQNKSAAIVAVDTQHDLAVLKVETDRKLACQSLGHSDDILVGETVIAIGNPLGLQHTVTAGIVSALNRDLVFSRDQVYSGLIQTDASINPGNSGGPLLNVNGALIGINTAIRGDAQNIGFAIPVDRLWELLPVMLDVERRERVKFGIQISGTQAEVLTVRPESPAAQAGVQPGDRIIRCAGQPVRNSIDYCVHLLEQAPGEEIKLAVQRGQRTVEIAVPLEAVPLPDGYKLAQQHLGLELAAISNRVRRRFDLPAHIGLIVQAVEARGPAGRAGVETGDLILRLDGMTAAKLEDVGRALERIKPGSEVVVEGLRLHTDPAFFWTVALQSRR